MRWAVGAAISAGVLLCVFSLVFHTISYRVLAAGLEYDAIIDSPRAPGYTAFADQASLPASDPIYYNATFFHLQNVDTVISRGARPSYMEIGPFVYRVLSTRVNTTFSPDRNQVSFYPWLNYMFEPTLSVADHDQVYVTNVNPGYLGVLGNTGGDFELLQAYAWPVLMDFMQFLTSTQFVSAVQFSRLPSELRQQHRLLSPPLSTADPTRFYQVWANSTTAPSSEWDHMLVSTPSSGPSGITLHSAEDLFNQHLPNSLTNTSSASFAVWMQASNQTFSTSRSARETLCAEFSLSADQLELILNWIHEQVFVYLIDPAIEEEFGVSTAEDLGFLQWGMCSVLKDGVTSVFPEQMFGTPYPEYGCYWKHHTPLGLKKLGTLPLNVTRQFFLSPTCSIATNVRCYGDFLEAELMGDFRQIHEVWGISEEELPFVDVYLEHVDLQVAAPQLKEVLANNGGLFANRTVREWLFQDDDPLIARLQPSDPSFCMLCNITKEEFVAKNKPATWWTGKDDIRKIQTWYKFQGSPTLDHGYNFSMPYGGYGTGQVPPFFQDYPHEVLEFFTTTYLRTVQMIYQGETNEWFDIPMWRYALSNSTLNPDPRYFDSIRGFANMTGIYDLATVFLSNPHFFQADEMWTEKLDGVRAPEAETDMTYFDMDPWTGKLMNVRLMVQINLYLPPNQGYFDLYYRNVTKDIMMPFAIIREMAHLSQVDAKEWHVLVADVLHDRFVGSICMLVLGLCLIVLGVVLEIVRLRCCVANERECDPTKRREDAGQVTPSYSMQNVASRHTSDSSETQSLLYHLHS